MLLHLCLHLAKHLKGVSYTLYWLSDLIEFLRMHQETLDIPHFLKLADTLNARKTVCGILALADTYGGVPLPAELADTDTGDMETPTLVLDPKTRNQKFLEGLIHHKQSLFKTAYTEYGPLAALHYGLRILFPPKQYIRNKCGKPHGWSFAGSICFTVMGGFGMRL